MKHTIRYHLQRGEATRANGNQREQGGQNWGVDSNVVFFVLLKVQNPKVLTRNNGEPQRTLINLQRQTMAKQNSLNPPSHLLRSKPHSSPDGAAVEAREVHCLVNAPFLPTQSASDRGV